MNSFNNEQLINLVKLGGKRGRKASIILTARGVDIETDEVQDTEPVVKKTRKRRTKKTETTVDTQENK